MMRKLWEKKMWGITGLYFVTGKELDFIEIPRKHIRPEAKLITIDQDGETGIDYTQEPFVYIVEDVEKFGLMLKSVPYTILKSGSLSDLAQYIELYGQPIRKGTYPAGDPDAKAELNTALKESGASLSMTIPEGANVEIIGDHVTSGNGAVHEVMFRTCNNELSILWLGNTESTGNDNGGSLAKSVVQQKQQQEIHKSDLKDMQDMLSSMQLQTILKSYGIPLQPGVGRFVFEKEFDVELLSKRWAIDSAVSAKVPVSDDYFYDTYGIPKPANYDELKAKMEEERQLKLAQPTPGNEPPKPGKKEKKPKVPNNSALSYWDKLRLTLSDFFGHGHNA
jgi:phage gp29-like protein